MYIKNKIPQHLTNMSCRMWTFNNSYNKHANSPHITQAISKVRQTLCKSGSLSWSHRTSPYVTFSLITQIILKSRDLSSQTSNINIINNNYININNIFFPRIPVKRILNIAIQFKSLQGASKNWLIFKRLSHHHQQPRTFSYLCVFLSQNVFYLGNKKIAKSS